MCRSKFSRSFPVTFPVITWLSLGRVTSEEHRVVGRYMAVVADILVLLETNKTFIGTFYGRQCFHLRALPPCFRHSGFSRDKQ
jgi:hypothetical protein